MRTLFIFVGIVSSLAYIEAQPAISNDGTGILNAASYSASVAQGSIFTIFGRGLGPSKGVEVSAYPLATTFQGVSITVSQGVQTVSAIPLYVSATQINAIMPSDAPLGSDAIAVSLDGLSSSVCCPMTTIAVVPASFGIFAVNDAGSGQGVSTDTNNHLISYASAAAPAKVLNIWGTGLGAIQGNDDVPSQAANVGSIIPIVYVGGVEIQPTYYGRSPCCSGLDQIQFEVPPNIAGCNVPLAVQIGGTVSNFVSVAITPDGGSCSDVNGITGPDFARLASEGIVATAYIGLSRSIDSQLQTQDYGRGNPGYITSTEDFGYANFEKYPYSDFSLTQLPLQILNFGACSVYTYNPAQTSLGPPFQVATPTINSISGVGLDAGTTITINGPNGEKQLTSMPSPYPASVGNYGAVLGESVDHGSPPLYMTPGLYTVNSPGGTDVGPFTVKLQMPQSLIWTNQSSLANITRANGATVTWSGADSSGYVVISGGSGGQGATNAAGVGNAGFNCTARATDGEFKIPPIVLLALPPSGVNESDGTLTSTAGLSVGIVAAPVSFNATGLGIGQAVSSFSITQSAVYQ